MKIFSFIAPTRILFAVDEQYFLFKLFIKFPLARYVCYASHFKHCLSILTFHNINSSFVEIEFKLTN